MKTHSYLSEIEKVCHNNHLTVDEIFLKLSQVYPKVGKSTIYRNVEEMLKKGSLRELRGAGEKCMYESTKEDHAHLISTNNGEIYDLSLTDLKISGLPPNFKVKNIDLRVYGDYS